MLLLGNMNVGEVLDPCYPLGRLLGVQVPCDVGEAVVVEGSIPLRKSCCCKKVLEVYTCLLYIYKLLPFCLEVINYYTVPQFNTNNVYESMFNYIKLNVIVLKSCFHKGSIDYIYNICNNTT